MSRWGEVTVRHTFQMNKRDRLPKTTNPVGFGSGPRTFIPIVCLTGTSLVEVDGT
jgi:hypothetical protein